MARNESVITLVEPFSSGHHFIYLVTFAKVLTDMGYKVEVLTSSSVIDKFPITNVRCRIIDYIDLKNLPTWRPFKILVVLYNMILKMMNLYKVYSLAKNDESVLFYCCLDDYIDNMIPVCILNLLMPYKWGGLLLNIPLRRTRRYAIFQSSNCLGVGVLTKIKNNPLKKYSKKIIDFPDFSDMMTPNKDCDLRNNILKLAKGRKIISLLGEISRRKGVFSFLEVMKLLPSDQYFFLLAGGVSLSLSMEELLLIERKISMVENSYFYPHRIQSEADFNSLIDITTVLYANYVDFFQSSNMLSKAAAFKKKLVVNKGGYMEEQVCKYKIGISVTNDPIECAKSIVNLVDDEYFFKKADFDGYLEMNSVAKLYDSFRILLNTKR